MVSNRAYLLSNVALSDTQSNEGWFHVLMEGEWEGHPNGAFEISEETIDAMIARFEKQRTPMLIDWYHKSLDPKTPEDGAAAGFATKLEKRKAVDGDGWELWAFAEWTDEAAALIRSGKIRYCSPVIDFEATDRRTAEAGIELFNIALTNQPFLDGQHAIQLHRITREDRNMTTKPKKKTALADMPPKDEDEGKEKVEAQDEQVESPPPDNTADVMAAMQLLAEATGIGVSELAKQVVANADAIASVLKGTGESAAMSREVLEAVTAELEDTRAELIALKADPRHAGKTVEQEVEGYVLCGRVKESRRAAAVDVLRKDRALFSRIWPEGTQEAPVGGQTTRVTASDKNTDAADSAAAASLTAAQRATFDYMRRMSRNGKRVYTDAQALERTLKHTSKEN